MKQLFSTIDKLLRGQYTRRETLEKGRIDIDGRALLLASLLLGVAYGVFMGLYGTLREEIPSTMQLFASAIKVPLLFLLTLAVTFPSLYVFSALAGSRLEFRQTLRFLMVGIVINLTLLASLGPVTGFFTLSTESYPFMIVLNVLFFGVSGIAGLIFMFRALGAAVALTNAPELSESASPNAADSSDAQGIDQGEANAENAKGEAPKPSPSQIVRSVSIAKRESDRTRSILTVWVVVYGVVGAQMGWILRPFIGSPDREFTFFRPRELSFFQGFFSALGRLFE